MESGYILGIDQSTSGTKVVLVDTQGTIVEKRSRQHEQFYPKPGWVEHDLDEIRQVVFDLISEVRAVSMGEIMGISITNQRETIAFWDKETGKSLCKAMVWQCRRGTDICKKLSEEGNEVLVMEKTGLRLDPYFSASKIMWALENIDSIQEAKKNKTLCIGTIDSWLIFQLTQGKIFATDHTNASRTMLYNIFTNEWDESLLALFGVETWMLPDIKGSDEIFGITSEEVIGIEIPIAGVIGDSQGALFGQQCFEEGKGKVTFGTGSSILLFIGNKRIQSQKGILTSVAWHINGETQYALEGIINSSGDTLRWMKDNLGLYEKEEDIEVMLNLAGDSEGVYVIPAFVGLGAPYWALEAKAAILGMTRKTNKNHLVRAGVESMAYQVADLLYLMVEESKTPLKELNADGGPSQNAFLVQFVSDLLQTSIHTSAYGELSVLGAVYLGGLGLNIWKDQESLKALRKGSMAYSPQIDGQQAQQLILGWQKAVNTLL